MPDPYTDVDPNFTPAPLPLPSGSRAGVQSVLDTIERLGKATGEWEMGASQVHLRSIQLRIKFQREIDVMGTGAELLSVLPSTPAMLADCCRKLLQIDDRFNPLDDRSPTPRAVLPSERQTRPGHAIYYDGELPAGWERLSTPDMGVDGWVTLDRAQPHEFENLTEARPPADWNADA